MPVFAWYFLKIILCSGIFYTYYLTLLRNRGFHAFNRFYLLASAMLSLLLPFLHINTWHAGSEAGNASIPLLNVVSSGNDYLDEIIVSSKAQPLNSSQLLLLFYVIICVFLLSKLLLGFYRLRKIYTAAPHSFFNNTCLVMTDVEGTPFSFFNYIFWNRQIGIDSAAGKKILAHELAHVRQKHTQDKLFMNVATMVVWCNPFFWLIKRELNMVHEFIADRSAIGTEDGSGFAEMILQSVYPQYHFSSTNSFFYSPLKRRFAMITKKQAGRNNLAGRLLTFPLLCITFAIFSFKSNTLHSADPGKPVIVVINAGHGGKDHGATDASGNLLEKDLSLAISKKIKELNTNDRIKIITTREDDSYQSPKEIASFTNAQKPDLYVSIHLNANEQQQGMEVFVAKDNFENAYQSKLFASAIIQQFAGHYPLPVASHPMQREKGIWTLQEIKCPAVIIEAGNLKSDKDTRLLQSETGQTNIAQNILIAIDNWIVANLNNATSTGAANDPSLNSNPKNGMIEKSTDTTTNATGISGHPLYILDGKEVSVTEMKMINPSMIERMDVLKNEAAVKVYGNKAVNGVVIITSKKNAVPSNENVAAAPSQPAPIMDKVFTKVENEASFTGGFDAWKKYLVSNLDAGLPAKEGWAKGKHTVIIQFIVNKEGNISNAKALNYEGSRTAAHCIKLIAEGPKWQPATQNGRQVNAYHKQPITFVVE